MQALMGSDRKLPNYKESQFAMKDLMYFTLLSKNLATFSWHLIFHRNIDIFCSLMSL